MKVSQSQLEEKIRLVRWQEGVVRQRFNLMTIHSLLLDSNPKFKHLKQIIENYNQESVPSRIKLQQSYMEKLFKMLSELSRIPVSENQIEYLNKIYQWAVTNNETDDSLEPLTFNDKARPVTATTKARSQSAYSRATTTRPISGNFQKRTVRNQELPPLNTNDPRIDYSKLKDGEKEFYCGLRSKHPEYQHPKKRLKDYQRKIFYEDGDDSDVQIIEIEPAVVVNEQKLIEEIELAQEEEALEEGQEAAVPENEENAEINIDDIPIEGEEEPADGQPEEEQEVVDKLRPKVKVYNNPKGADEYNHKNYQNGMVEIRKMRNYDERKVDEDVELAQLGAMWAQSKGRAKSELKRRAESARIFKNKIGIGFEKPPPPETEKQRENIINFQNVAPLNVNSKSSRPLTAFTAASSKTREELIKNAFITGKLSVHTRKYEPGTAQSIPSEFNIVGSSLATHGGPPKKKTFEEILREAEERVIKDSHEEVMGVKEVFAKNKISIGANRIAKSISYNDKELPEGEQFTGLITGMTMLKNPFIKVAKKKKKKKKK